MKPDTLVNVHMDSAVEELLKILERAVRQPAKLAEHVKAYLRAYWAFSDERLPYGTALSDALHDLGHDWQDYQPRDDPDYEPTLLHDREVLVGAKRVLTLAGRLPA
jgi:hypothetical protein